jgi:hypothetical protein
MNSILIGTDLYSPLITQYTTMTTAPPPTKKQCVAQPVKATQEDGIYKYLYSNPLYSDVILVAEDQKLYAHRCILAIVPYFEAAFRTGAGMKEGEGPIFVMNLDISYTSLCNFVSFVYGVPREQSDDISSLLLSFSECQLFGYKPFSEITWANVTALRAKTKSLFGSYIGPQQRAQSIGLAALHGLPLIMSSLDNDKTVSEALSYSAALYFVQSPLVTVISPSLPADIQTFLALYWIEMHPTAIESECKELLRSCPAAVSDVRGLLKYAKSTNNHLILHFVLDKLESKIPNETAVNVPPTFAFGNAVPAFGSFGNALATFSSGLGAFGAPAVA